jgi:FkbM family methyltransferase
MTDSLARHLTRIGALDESVFIGVDVGASGGVFDLFAEFAPNCRAFAFDILEHEVSRLADESPDWVSYHCAQVGDPEWKPVERATPGVYTRSSANAYSAVTGLNYAQEYFNSGEVPRVTENRLGLDDFLTSVGSPRVDFLKSDTDGNELGVLRSAPSLLNGALAVFVETNFDAETSADANSFCTIALELGRHGFRLFDLQLWRYSRAAFPMPFEYEVPAQTTHGQVYSGDGLFCRDLLDEEEIDVLDAVKMACIFDFFGLQDCAAELILDARISDRLSSATREEILAVLGRRSILGLDPRQAGELFDADPSIFLPSARERRIEVASRFGANGREVQALTPSRIAIGEPLATTSGGVDASIFISGWHEPEATGTWSSAPVSHLNLVVERALPAGTEIGFTLTAPASTSVALETRTSLVVPSLTEVSTHVVRAVPHECRLTVPERVEKGAEIRVVITSSRLVVPSLEGWSQDERLIGVFLSEVRIVSR